MEVDRVPEIQNDCSFEKDIIRQLPHTDSEILDAVTIVKTIEDSKIIISHLIDYHQIISLDVKGRDLGTNRGKISLIAVGTCNGQCILFDIHCNNELVIKGKLKNMLICKELIKVMHDCCLIRLALEQCFGVKINSIFDTQCAHAVIEGYRWGINPRCVSHVPLSFISTTYGRGILTPASHALERLYLENSNFWDTRPMPYKLKNFAARGVLALLPEVYNNMNRRLCGPLRQTFRTLCHEKCIPSVEYDVPHDQRSSLEDSCNNHKQNRSISGDFRSRSSCISPKKTCMTNSSTSANNNCRCRSYSLISQSSNQSDNNEAYARCEPSNSICPPKSTHKTSCTVPKCKKSLCRCVSTSDCTPKKNQKCVQNTSTRVSCNCVQCTQRLAEKACPRRHCVCTAKIASCNCVMCTENVTRHSCASKKKKTNFKSKSLSNVCLSYNKSGSLSSCIPQKKKGKAKSSTLANYGCSKPTSVKSKANCRNQSRLQNNCLKRKLTRSKTLAGKKRPAKPIIKHRKIKCGNQCIPIRQNSTCLCKTLETNEDLRFFKQKAQMDMESEMDYENEEMDEEEQNVVECNDEDEEADDDDDEEEFEMEILPSAAKRKRS